MKFNRALLGAAILSTSLNAYANPVPAGTVLAEKQEIVLNNGSEVTSIDPAKQGAEPAFNLGRDLFEGLTLQDKEGRTIPGIALSWSANADNTVYTFKLRKSNWSNGEPLTAKDFVYSWQRLIDPATASPYSWFVAIPGIKNSAAIMKGDQPISTLGVRAVDDYTFEVTLDAPVPYFVKLLSHPVLAPVHQATVEKHGTSWTQPKNIVTNGAFTVSDWKVNEKLVMQKNSKYWDASNVVLNKITWLPIGDANVSLNRFLAGEIAELRVIPAAQKAKLLKSHSAMVADRSASLGSTFNYLNIAKGPTKDIRVRKALAYALDRNIITKAILKGGQVPMFTLVPPQTDGFKSFKPEFSQWTQKERNAKAKALIEEAGYGKDNPLKLTFTTPTFATDVKMATAMAGMWKQTLGAQIDIKQQEPKVFYGNKNPGNIHRGGWTADYNEASTWLDLFVSGAAYNRSFYSNANYDKHMKAAKTMADPSAAYNLAEQQLVEDMAFLPIYRNGADKYLLHPTVGGYELTNPENSFYRKNVYIKAK